MAVGEASGFGSFEGFNNKGQHTLLIDLIVVHIAVENIIKSEMMLFNILGEINFLSIIILT